MELKRALELLSELEADGKLRGETVSVNTLFDASGLITLNVLAVDVATREKFLADLLAVAEPEAADEPETAKPAKKKAGKK